MDLSGFGGANGGDAEVIVGWDSVGGDSVDAGLG